VARAWAANVTAEVNKQKQTLIAEYECLDIDAEGRSLDEGERARMKEAVREIEKIWALEDIKVRQRSRDRSVLEGDRNTTYFHAVASQRHRKKRIECILGPQGLVHENSEILKVAAEIYKNLFRSEDRGACSLRPDFWGQDDLLTREESEALEAPISESEIKEVVFSCYPVGAPGPDGLPFLFYQKYWEYVKHDIFNLFKYFQEGSLDLFRLNFAMLTLIPKVENACEMKNFRPISLLNCSFKMFSKMLTLRLEKICNRIIAKEQSAFIRGRYILESVVVAHEVVHSIHKSKATGVILKLDYEKAYDRVNLDFLLEIIRLRGFGETWMR
jgi:hypothetical protein